MSSSTLPIDLNGILSNSSPSVFLDEFLIELINLSISF